MEELLKKREEELKNFKFDNISLELMLEERKEKESFLQNNYKPNVRDSYNADEFANEPSLRTIYSVEYKNEEYEINRKLVYETIPPIYKFDGKFTKPIPIEYVVANHEGKMSLPSEIIVTIKTPNKTANFYFSNIGTIMENTSDNIPTQLVDDFNSVMYFHFQDEHSNSLIFEYYTTRRELVFKSGSIRITDPEIYRNCE